MSTLTSQRSLIAALPLGNLERTTMTPILPRMESILNELDAFQAQQQQLRYQQLAKKKQAATPVAAARSDVTVVARPKKKQFNFVPQYSVTPRS